MAIGASRCATVCSGSPADFWSSGIDGPRIPQRDVPVGSEMEKLTFIPPTTAAPMRVLVTGRTGFLGRQFVSALCKAGADVQCAVRAETGQSLPGVQFHHADRLKGDAASEEVKIFEQPPVVEPIDPLQVGEGIGLPISISGTSRGLQRGGISRADRSRPMSPAGRRLFQVAPPCPRHALAPHS